MFAECCVVHRLDHCYCRERRPLCFLSISLLHPDQEAKGEADAGPDAAAAGVAPLNFLGLVRVYGHSSVLGMVVMVCDIDGRMEGCMGVLGGDLCDARLCNNDHFCRRRRC